MRLTLEQIEAIKQTAHAVLGAESRVILFGSRTDDAKKGGDIDLLFETTHRVENRATTIRALDLAHKEAAHLRYSQVTLFAQSIDLAWVQTLSDRPEVAEKVEAFVSRFGRLQDHLGDKLLPRLAALVGENSKTLLDALAG